MTRRWGWLIAAVAGFAVATAALAYSFARRADDSGPPGITVGEKLDSLKSERAALQARADGRARIELLGALRVASLLADALAVRGEAANERALDRLPHAWRQALAALDALDMALADALARPGAGATLAAQAAARRGQAALDRLAGGNGLPLVLAFTPRFVPPRRATGELTLAAPGDPRTHPLPPQDAALHLATPAARSAPQPTVSQPTVSQPIVPLYAPPFAAAREDDPPVAVEIVGLHLASGGTPPVLSLGDWRGEGEVSPERLRFAVPRRAFATAAARTTLVAGTLVLRHDGRTVTFELPFVVLPDRPGSLALDQKVRSTVAESNTLVSPAILARAGVGESRTVHRCFDPPPGWRFDKANSRVVVVERLGWVDDISDPTMNAGDVQFAAGKPQQICVDVAAKPAAKTARTATIGRFEATLVRDKEEDSVVHTGIRALDWREPVRVPLEAGAVAWKLYVRLFDEVDRDFADGVADIPFVHIALEEKDGERTLVLSADPAAAPAGDGRPEGH